MNYTTRTNVEAFLNQTFPEIGTTEFNLYLAASERYINNYLGYNAETTTSGILTESITREKSIGKLDAYGNLVIDLMHGPLHFDANANPLVSFLSFNLGAVEVSLQTTDGTQNVKNTVIESSENRKKIYYPNMYFLPAVSTVTPSTKVNLFGLQDLKFFVDISYIGGYDTVPEDIVLATNYICAEFVLHRKNPQFLAGFTQGTMSQSYGRKLPNAKGANLSDGLQLANMLLQPYVRYAF